MRVPMHSVHPSLKLSARIILHRIALRVYPKWLSRAGLMDSLADLYSVRSLKEDSMPDLDKAVALRRKLLELCPEGHPGRADSLLNLASCLHSRFELWGTLLDLDEAFALLQRGLELRSEAHPERVRYLLNDISSFLHFRFEQLGSLPDLDNALSLQRAALELYPEENPYRVTSLNLCAISLHSRFKQLRFLPDINEAIFFERDALEILPEGHDGRASLLANLSCFYHSRFDQLGTTSDLDEAVSLQRSALELRPEGHPDRATSLHNLAFTLRYSFKRFGNPSDLEEAISFRRTTLKLCPEGHPDRADSLLDLARCLHSRFGLFEMPSDLEEALPLARSAFKLYPEGHQYWTASLSTIARCLYDRFSLVHDVSDLQEISNLYVQLSSASPVLSFRVLERVKGLIQTAEEHKHDAVVLLYKPFLRFIVQHLATLPSLPEHLAVLKELIGLVPVDAFSACIRHGNPADAVELLEQGRGAFWYQLFRLRSPLDEVMASGDTGKELADKYKQLASLLRTPLDSSPDSKSQRDQAFHVNTQLQAIIAKIRKLPGLSHFLQPLLFSDLRHAAVGGPVIIINAGKYTCDALIVLPDKDPVHVALPITKTRVCELPLELRSLTSRAETEVVTNELRALLRELWSGIVFPIVEIVQDHCPPESRIWWCPTAELSLLPLHAAGPFRKGQKALSDLYVSSYTPTLTALIRARQERSFNPSMERHRFLLVGQAQAPGLGKLECVDDELSNISQRIGPASTITRIQGENATIANVTEAFKKSEFVHIACHGIPNQKQPFESGFALGDGRLKVKNIMQYDLQNARFAYLSACHTTVGDEESPDEVIHLAAAMQFAGFRSVIGTMWGVDDKHAGEIASKFYEHMLDESGRLDHTRAALALHKTMHGLRSSSEITLDQRIVYVHIGA